MNDHRPPSTAQSVPGPRTRDRRAFVEDVLWITQQVIYVREVDGGRHLFESRSLRALLGHPPAADEVGGGAAPDALLHDADREVLRAHRAALAAAPDEMPLEVEYRLRDATGAWRWMHAREAVHARDDDGTVTQVVGVVHDISERIELDRVVRRQASELTRLTWRLTEQRDELEIANARLERLAATDSLTGLRNRGAMQARLEAEFTHARAVGLPLAVVMIDVDHFKAFNDDFGHPAGDRVLVRVADVLRGCARETDLVARYGGEEFVIVLPATDRAGALIVAERVRTRVAAAVMAERAVTASVGIALLVPAHTEPAALLADADRALYAAKHGGRDRVVGAWQRSPWPFSDPRGHEPRGHATDCRTSIPRSASSAM